MDGYSLQITPEAEADIDDAYEYIAYHLENPQAAFELTDGIYAAIEGLSLMPSRFPIWKREPTPLARRLRDASSFAFGYGGRESSSARSSGRRRR